MSRLTFRNKTRATVLGTRIELADDFLSRLKGLRGRTPGAGEGMLLVPCRAIHSFGMQAPVDVVFLDRHGTVVGLEEDLPPRRISLPDRRTRSVLEVPSGTIRASGTRVGDHLAWTGSESPDGPEAPFARTGEPR